MYRPVKGKGKNKEKETGKGSGGGMLLAILPHLQAQTGVYDFDIAKSPIPLK